MKHLTICSIAFLLAACAPRVDELCESLSECGRVADTASCQQFYEDLQDEGETNGCLDEVYAVVQCQTELDYTCSDDFDSKSSEQCSIEECQFDGCFTYGSQYWHDAGAAACTGGGLDVSGVWSVRSRTAQGECGTSGRYLEMEVVRSGAGYDVTFHGVGVVGTATITNTPDPVMDVSYEWSGTDDTGASITHSSTLSLTATQPPGDVVQRINGTGTLVHNGCTAQVTATGQVRKPL